MTIEEKKKELRDVYMSSLLNKRQVARELGGISTETLDRMRKDNSIQGCKHRGQIMFKLEEVSRYLVEVL